MDSLCRNCYFIWGIWAWVDSVSTVVFKPISYDRGNYKPCFLCLFQKGRVHRNLTESDQRARSWGQEAHNGHEGERGADQGTGTEGSGEEEVGRAFHHPVPSSLPVYVLQCRTAPHTRPLSHHLHRRRLKVPTLFCLMQPGSNMSCKFWQSAARISSESVLAGMPLAF